MENNNHATRSMKKRLMVLIGAAVIAASGNFATPGHPALAAAAVQAEAAQTIAHTDQIDFITLLVYKQLPLIVLKAAAVAEQDYNQVLVAVESGSSLAEATGMGAASLVEALRDDFRWELDRDVMRGSITRQQADEALQEATSLFEEAVSGSRSAKAAASVFPTRGVDVVERRLASIVQDAAFWAKKSTIEIRQALREGQTLNAAAIRDESGADSTVSDIEDTTLSEYLVGLLQQDLDGSVRAGELTAEAAAESMEKGTQAIDRILGTARYEPETSVWMQKVGESLLHDRLDWIIMDTALLSDQESSEVIESLEQGGTLVSASGMTESDLLAGLGAKADEAIESAWRSGSVTVKLADELKQKAAERLKEAVRMAGYGTAASADARSDSGVAEASLRHMIERSASYANLSAVEVRDALKAGQTLVEATGVEHDELLMVLQSTTDAYINAAVGDGTLAQGAAALTKAEAGHRLEQAIETRGYVPKVGVEAYVQERLERVVADAAALANKPADELLLALAQGRLLADEVGTDNGSLVYKLLSDVNRELNDFVVSGSLTEEESQQALTDYTSRLLDVLGLSQ